MFELIDHLQEIKDKFNKDVEVEVMCEHEVDGRVIQFQSGVTRVPHCTSMEKGVDKGLKYVVVVGQELD